MVNILEHRKVLDQIAGDLTAENAGGERGKALKFSAISAVRKVISRLHKNDHNLLDMFSY